ncbi:hypothetical protein [Gelidibacter japonicus]|uniref:hypothetical protein n=1 Tax=Gelidibacter japonicus TaxID=1962232 RepID=UPI001963438E|nr:hypothetical protein [Gelidibacter japonicus]
MNGLTCNYTANLQWFMVLGNDLGQLQHFLAFFRKETGSGNFQFPVEAIHFISTNKQPIKSSISGNFEKHRS